MTITRPQDDPVAGREAVGDLLLRDIVDRIAFGREKYGTELMTENGRNPLVDGYQEVLDLAFYVRQAIEEQKNDYRDLQVAYNLVAAVRHGAAESGPALGRVSEILSGVINRRLGYNLGGK